MKEDLIEYKDMMMRVKLNSYAQCTVLDINNQTIAICQGMQNSKAATERVTSAPAIDPLLVLALATQLLSISG